MDRMQQLKPSAGIVVLPAARFKINTIKLNPRAVFRVADHISIS
jgi:hypothetical protein